MTNITIILFSGTKDSRHITNACLVREGMMQVETNWDEIKTWVASGHVVTLRPPTETELAGKWGVLASERSSRGY